MEHRWISKLTARALNWGAWAVVALSVLGSLSPWETALGPLGR